MAISAKDVMNLRAKSGLGMMECKAALEEAGGDMQKAIDILRTKGLAKMDGRTDRPSAEGRVGLAMAPDKNKAAVVEINTETDFTAKNESFLAMVAKIAQESLKQPAGQVTKTDQMQAAIDEVRITTKENVQFGRGVVMGGGAGRIVGSYVHFTGKIGVLVELEVPAGVTVSDELLNDLCMHVAAVSPSPISIDEDGVPADVLAKEKEIAKAQAMEQGKPEAIAEKMVVGKIRKFCEENCLNLQMFIKDDKKRIKDILPKGATIKNFVRVQVGIK